MHVYFILNLKQSRGILTTDYLSSSLEFMANPLYLSGLYLSFTSIQTSLSEMGHQGDPRNYTRNLRACVTVPYIQVSSLRSQALENLLGFKM